MGKQKAKELRTEQAKARRNAIHRITITVMPGEDGWKVEATGIPQDLDTALSIMSAAQRAVCGAFLRDAQEDERAMEDVRIESNILKARVVEAILWREIEKFKTCKDMYRYADDDPRHLSAVNSVDMDPAADVDAKRRGGDWTADVLTSIWHGEVQGQLVTAGDGAPAEGGEVAPCE